MLVFNITAYGQSILGKWETYNGNKKENGVNGIIEIKKAGEIYSAKIIENFDTSENSTCEKCTGDKKNQPIIGLDIIEGIQKNGNKFDDGTILNPKSGEVYKCYLKLVEPNKLKIRAYSWLTIMGKTQYLRRKE